jgi:hypothetical protein
MESPHWYSEWRHEAVHELQDKIALLKAEFRLGDWPRYDYDLEIGTLTFSEDGVPKVIAEIQIAGSTSANAGNWLWSWANTHWPPERVTDAAVVRAYGEEHGIRQLTHDFVEDDGDLNALGWELTAVMARLTGAVGAYRPPRDEGGGLFLTYKKIAWAT